MQSLSLTISRTQLGKSNLVVTNTPQADGLHISGVTAPTFDVVYHRAEAGMFTNGRRLLGATLDVGTLPVRFVAQSSTHAGVVALQNTLTEALWQFYFTLTLTVAGSSESWAADPSRPVWGDIAAGDVAACVAACSVSIPLNPA